MSTTGRDRTRRLLALVIAVGVAAAACSSSSGGTGANGSDNVTDSAEGSTTTTVPTDPDGVVKVGYDLVLQATGGFGLDPSTQPTSTNDAILYLIYGRLMRPTREGDLEPDLAKSATLVDVNTIDIVVRDGVTFQDGTPFDAAAVKAGLDRSLAANNVAAFNQEFFSLQSVTVTAPNAVRLSIPDGTAPSWYDSFLGSWQTSIVKTGTDFSRPVGAGPFSVADYQPEQSLSLAKYNRYWDAASIKVAGIDFTQIAADQLQSGVAAVQAGQIDLAITDASQLPALTGNVKSLVIDDPNQTVTMQLCKRDGPLADAKVRRAINKAIDREAISAAVYQGTAKPATQLWPEGNRFYDASVADTLAYDPAAARDLLAQTEYKDGFSFDMYIVPALGLPDAAQVIQQQLAAVGVTVNIKPSANFVTDFLVPQSAGAGLIPGSATGLNKLDAWVGDSLGNACKYDDPALDALLGQLALVSQTSDEAVGLWKQATEKVVQDALGVFILFRSGLAAYNSDRLAEVAAWPVGNVVVPDPRATAVRLG